MTNARAPVPNSRASTRVGGNALEYSEDIAALEIMISTITAAEARRQQMSNVMIALITAAFGSIGVLDLADPIVPIGVALFLSVIWTVQLRHMQLVAQAKWGVVIDHEKRLNVRLFTEEYERIKEARKSMPTWRKRQTAMELLIPRALILGFSAYLAYRFLESSGAFEWQ